MTGYFELEQGDTLKILVGQLGQEGAGFNQGGGGYTGTITLAPPGYLVVPALSSSGKLLLAAALLGSAVIWRRRPRAA